MSFTPTTEQQAVRKAFATGNHLVVKAGAGTGKTATLKLLADDAQGRRGQYLAFNRAIVDEAKAKFPSHVAANTAHSLAFRTTGKQYQHRLNSSRLKSDEVAKRLAIDPIEITTTAGRKRLAPGFLAGHVMRAVGGFCQSADERPASQHFAYIDGIDLPTAEGHRTWANNQEVRDHLLRPLAAAWADLSAKDGMLRFTHDCYLKLWQLGAPRIGADFILLDEAQDTNPVLLDVFWNQADHAQLVAVGDDNQAIYEWRGAINALEAIETLGAEVVYLSQSFRFGHAIADEANKVLATLPTELRLSGTPTIASVVCHVDLPTAILTRTNAEAMRSVLDAIADGKRPHLVGGGGELTSFARAAKDLMEGRRTSHPELACFDNWGEVQDYVANDQQGDELRLLVKLMDEYGPQTILNALDRMPREENADLIVSTAHKSKGREWDAVRLAADFPDGEKEISDPEQRLLYVAITRAKVQLDITLVGCLAPKDEDDEIVAGEVQAPSGMIGTEAAPATSNVPSCPKCGRTDVFDAAGALVFNSDHLC